MQQQFLILGSSPALGWGVGVTSMSWAGAGLTSVQTQQCWELKLLHHLHSARFPLLRIQFITSVTEIKCQQKGASTSCALWLIQSTQQFLWPTNKYSSLSPKVSKDNLLFLFYKPQPRGQHWVSLLFNWVRFMCQTNTTPLMWAL